MVRTGLFPIPWLDKCAAIQTNRGEQGSLCARLQMPVTVSPPPLRSRCLFPVYAWIHAVYVANYERVLINKGRTKPCTPRTRRARPCIAELILHQLDSLSPSPSLRRETTLIAAGIQGYQGPTIPASRGILCLLRTYGRSTLLLFEPIIGWASLCLNRLFPETESREREKWRGNFELSSGRK